MMIFLDDKNFESEFEKAFGKKPSKGVVKFADSFNKVAERFRNKGREDGALCKPVPDIDVFIAWGRKVFYDDPELADGIAELMHETYLDAYRAGRGCPPKSTIF